MPIDFYYCPISPPCRAVMLLARTIGVHLNLKLTDPLKGEHLKPEFVKLNPQHVVPTINDNGFILWESRAIIIYLVDRYAKNDSLYPKDLQKRGIVDQRLQFDAGSLYDSVLDCYAPVCFGQMRSVDEKRLQTIHKYCDVLNNVILEGHDFVAGDELTIGDIALSTTISSVQCFDFDFSPYDNISNWFERCRTALQKFGFDEVHEPGKMFTEMYQANLQASG